MSTGRRGADGEPDDADDDLGALGDLEGDPVLQLLEEGPPYDPAPLRERTRSVLAITLVAILAGVAAALIACEAFGAIDGNQTKDLAAAIFSPLIALTGTALGFYYGGHHTK